MPGQRKRKRVYRPRKKKQIISRAMMERYGLELKFYDTSAAGNTLTTNTDGSGSEQNPSATIALSTIVQGDGEQNRDGRRATFESIYINGSIDYPTQVNQTTPEIQFDVFIALVLDTQTNGILLDSESVYLNVGGATGTGTLLQRNLRQSKRFQVLKTRRVLMPVPFAVFDGTNFEQYGARRHWQLYHTFRTPIVANYSGTTETIANSTDNSLHLLAFASSAVQAPTISYSSRLRFRG